MRAWRRAACWARIVAVPTRALIGAERVGRIVRILGKQSASTAASSIAIAAPCARNGSIGWAASPSSVTGSRPAAEWDLAVKERPFQPAVRNCDERACLFRPGPADKVAEHFRPVPAAVQPGSFHSSRTMPTMLMRRPGSPDSAPDARRGRARDERRAHEIRLAPTRPGRGRARRCDAGTSAVADCAGVRQLLTRYRRHRSGRCRARRAPANRACLDGDAVDMGGEVLDAHAQLKRHIESVMRRIGERRLQVAAMDRPVWRAVASFGLVTERNARDLASGRRPSRGSPAA